MPLSKPIKDLKLAVFLSAYKRPEYTKKCIESLEACEKPCSVKFYLVDDGSNDSNSDILTNAKLDSTVKISPENRGLRDTCIDFFEFVQRGEFDIIAKADNDCRFPKNWLSRSLEVFELSDADILSPNVMPSNAAFAYGKSGSPYRPAEIVGGLWIMKADLIKDVFFERHPTLGLTGVLSILKQIVNEKEPKVGWLADVVVEDIGHWSGKHAEHIKSREHELYSLEIGRQIAWRSM